MVVRRLRRLKIVAVGAGIARPERFTARKSPRADASIRPYIFSKPNAPFP